MGTVFARKTIETAKKFLTDPMFMVDEDGKVWKRIGLPDAVGDRSAHYRTGPKEWTAIPVSLLVYLKYVGDIKPSAKVSITTVDGDPNNIRPSNLRLVEKREPPATRRHISADLRASMLQDHAAGMAPIEIAEKYGISLPHVNKALFTKNGG